MTIDRETLRAALIRGLNPFRVEPPLGLSDWAIKHFYLSAESSYTRGRWRPYPYQIGIMNAVSNDAIRKIVLIKSARVGYTKILLAYMGYLAAHKKRNQAMWRPVDDDAAQFVKTELDPMIRDVVAVRKCFPNADKQNRNNTLNQKAFLGSMLYVRGGKSANNYRSLSVDSALLDELDTFLGNVDKEGDPVTLAAKRVEGSLYPKVVLGSTPKIKGTSLIEKEHGICEKKMKFYIPCPSCGEMQPLSWGGKNEDHGFKWVESDPETVAYACCRCKGKFSQAAYLAIAEKGLWTEQDGGWMENDGRFFDATGADVTSPRSLGLHIWTAYSEMQSWQQLVRDFYEAKKDRDKLQAFTNTTLGETWDLIETEKIPFRSLWDRREVWKAELPTGVMALTAGIDTHDDGFYVIIDGWGIGEERWCVEYVKIVGDPSRPDVWRTLSEFLGRGYSREDGSILNVSLACQDHGGHYGDAVCAFSRAIGVSFLIPVKGSSVYGRPVVTFPRKKNEKMVYLSTVGTDTAKDLMFQRLHIAEYGPGYWHFPEKESIDPLFFQHLTNEERVAYYVNGKRKTRWQVVDKEGKKAKSKNNEPWDCSVYSLAAVRLMQQVSGLDLRGVKNGA
jgi:phage terminase large subunit GpA-like protein